MRVQRGRETVTVPGDDLRAAVAAHARTLVDLGTGDGRFALRAAREDPGRLVVGVDPVAEAMRESSWRASRKPARGGAPNAWFVVGSLEALPAALHGVADEVTVNFPWGSLLEAVSVPRPEGLATLGAVLKPGGELSVVLNRSAQLDPAYAGRIGVPVLDDAHVRETLLPGYAAAGFEALEERSPAGRTSWGRRLVEGSGRNVLALRFRAGR